MQSMWGFVTFVVLAGTIFVALDPLMGVVLIVWLATYGWVAWKLLPPLRAAGRRTADERSILNGRMVDAFTNILAVKLYDSGRREHSYVREGMQRFLDAVRKMTRAITAVRTAVAVLNGFMIAAVVLLAIHGWMQGTASTGEV